MLVFDLTNQASFKSLGSWKNQFLLKCNIDNKDEIPFLVIGNKIDLEQRRLILFDTAHDWCEENGFSYIETSAKTGEGVVKAFEEIAEKFNVQDVYSLNSDDFTIDENKIHLESEVYDEINSNSCCFSPFQKKNIQKKDFVTFFFC
jgi:Ras-related protein Rab-7A